MYVPKPQYGPGWHFLSTFYARSQLAANDWLPKANGETTEFRHARLLQANAAVRQLDTLSRTVCQICGGYGHSKKMCPTLARINVVAMSGPVARNLLSQTKGDLIVANAAHMQGGAQPPKSTLPYAGYQKSGGVRSKKGFGQPFGPLDTDGMDPLEVVCFGQLQEIFG